MFKKLGIKEINYEPAVFDEGEPKFIYVRQKFSGTYKILIPKLIPLDFDLNKFHDNYSIFSSMSFSPLINI